MFDQRVSAEVGRCGRLELEFARRTGRTVVVHAYAEPPFRVGRVFEIGDAGYIIIVCTGAGIFAGDSLQQSIRLGPGARVMLTSQSALQIRPSLAPTPATFEHQYSLGDGAELHCHWDPIIPFAKARVVQRFDVQMEGTSRLCWSDAAMSGRVARGETWQFDTLDHQLRVRIDGALRYLERYQISPSERHPDRRWMAGKAHYFATTLVHHERVCRETGEEVRRELRAVADVATGVDVVDSKLLVARVLAEKGVPFASARTRCRQAVLKTLFESPELVGRKSV